MRCVYLSASRRASGECLCAIAFRPQTILTHNARTLGRTRKLGLKMIENDETFFQRSYDIYFQVPVLINFVRLR